MTSPTYRFGRLLVMIAAAAGGLAASVVANAEITWTMANQTAWTVTSGTDCGTSCSSLMGNTRTFSGGSGSPSVTAAAWANTGGLTGSSNSINGTLQTAYLGLYSGGGLGVKNRDGGTESTSNTTNFGDSSEWVSPEHGMDNQSRYDSILFSFANSIDLNKVTVGWISGDADITVLAYTGPGAPTLLANGTPNLTGTTYNTLSGWSFIGNYSAASLTTPTTINVNPGNVSSMYWLVSTAIPGLGGTVDSNYDYVKILALYGDKTKQVPEPHALLLFGIAAAGMWATRRRRTA